jgi:Tfp pilus assembly protein PilF
MKSRSRILIAAFAASMLASCAPSPAERMTRAQQAMAEHRYSLARPDLQAVLQDDPKNRAAQVALVRVFIAQENPSAAVELLERMARSGPLAGELRLLRSQAHLMLGGYDDALTGVAGDDSAEAWRIRAIARTGRGEPEQAALAFENGQHAPGPRARLLADYAHFLMSQNDLAGARGFARQAVQADTAELSALLVNGDIAMGSKQFRQALSWYSQAVRAYPENRPALFGRITALAELKRFDDVRKLVSAAREASPQDTELLYLEARLAADRKDWGAVRTLLQPYETSLETMPEANALYAEAFMHLGQAEQARTRLSSQLLREPDNRPVRILLGEAKLAVQDAEGALDTLAPVAEWPDANARERALLAKAQALTSGG